jgi:Icc-related predicted phosphoesterase
MKNFNLLFITDIHQQKENLKKIDFNSFDYIFCAGDFLDSSNPNLELAKELVCLLPDSTYLIPGNLDKPEELRLLMNEKTIYMEKNHTKLSGTDLPIAGIGGARDLEEDIKLYRDFFLEDKKRIDDFIAVNGIKSFILKFCGIIESDNKNEKYSIVDNTSIIEDNRNFIENFLMFKEDDLADFEKSSQSLSGGILLSHSPPHGALDKLPGLPNAGGRKIANIIKEKQPSLVLCGHFHELSGITTLYNSVIFNPGALKDGFYGVVEFKENQKPLCKSFKL